MLIETTQIVFGPGRFVPAGSRLDLSAWEANELINSGKAVAVESAALASGPENAMKTNKPRLKPQGRGS